MCTIRNDAYPSTPWNIHQGSASPPKKGGEINRMSSEESVIDPFGNLKSLQEYLCATWCRNWNVPSLEENIWPHPFHPLSHSKSFLAWRGAWRGEKFPRVRHPAHSVNVCKHFKRVNTYWLEWGFDYHPSIIRTGSLFHLPWESLRKLFTLILLSHVKGFSPSNYHLCIHSLTNFKVCHTQFVLGELPLTANMNVHLIE